MNAGKSYAAAFPLPRSTGHPEDDNCGMSLRAYIATKQMAAIVNAAAFNQGAEDMLLKAGVKLENFMPFFAMLSVQAADALIAELGKETK